MRKSWTRTANRRSKPPSSSPTTRRDAGPLTEATTHDASRDSRSAAHGCSPRPILTKHNRPIEFVPLKKYGTMQNSTPHPKDDYNSRFDYVRATQGKELHNNGLMCCS